MRCPRDVNKRDFEHMLSLVPDGFVLIESRVPKHPWLGSIWRDFVFMVDRDVPQANMKRGDRFVLSVARKITRSTFLH